MAQPYSYMNDQSSSGQTLNATKQENDVWSVPQYSSTTAPNLPESGGTNNAWSPSTPFSYNPTVNPLTNYGFPNPNTGTMQGSAQQPGTFGAGGILGFGQGTAGMGPITPGSFTDKNEPLSRYLENYGFPAAQLQQNAYQYQNDADEAQRRWMADFNWQRQGDQFNMALATQQQNAAQWQAQTAANQWSQQFGQNQLNDTRNYGLAQGNLSLAQLTQSQNYAIAQQANQIDQMWKSGQLSRQDKEIALAQLTQKQNNALAQSRLGLDTTVANQNFQLGQGQNQTAQFVAQTQRDLGQQANQIDRMWKAGQLSNQQREIALAELTQRNNYAMAQAQFGLQQQIANRGTYEQQQSAAYKNAELAMQQRIATGGNYEQQQAAAAALREFELQKQIVTSGTWDQQAQQAFLNAQMAQQGTQFGQKLSLEQQIATAGTYEQQQAAAYQNAQLAQQAALAREQMASQEQQARWSQFGRGATPNSRWVRSWQ